MFQPQTGRNW